MNERDKHLQDVWSDIQMALNVLEDLEREMASAMDRETGVPWRVVDEKTTAAVRYLEAAQARIF